MMSWFDKLLLLKIKQIDLKSCKGILEGLWVKCLFCEVVFYCNDVDVNLYVCLKCDYYMCIGVCECFDGLFDLEGCYEIGQEIVLVDMLKFKDSCKYFDCLKEVMDEIGEIDVMVVMGGVIYMLFVVVVCFEFLFMGGLMGLVVGECFVCGVQNVLEQYVLFICFIVLGGVWMQESLLLLMQMVKIIVMLIKFVEVKLLFILVLIDLMMGGVLVSFVFFGDVVIVELKVLIGFVGLCVIEQMVCEKLLEGFQCVEFLLKIGVIDMIVDCCKMCDEIVQLFVLLQ